MQMSFVTVDFEYALSSIIEKKMEGDGGWGVGGGGGEPDNRIMASFLRVNELYVSLRNPLFADYPASSPPPHPHLGVIYHYKSVSAKAFAFGNRNEYRSTPVQVDKCMSDDSPLL